MNYSTYMLDIFEGSGNDVEEKNVSLISTCAASSFLTQTAHEISPSADIIIRVIQLIYNGLIFTVGAFFNLLIVYLVAKFKEMRSTSFYIAVQIVLVDLWGICMLASYLANHFSGRWVLGETFCITSAFFFLIIGSVRSNLVLVFAVDRFSSVFAPFNYPKYSSKVTKILCGLCWCYSVVICIIIIPPLLDCYTLFDTIPICSYYHGCNEKCQIFHYFFLATHFIPVLTIPLGLFIALYAKGIKIRCKDSVVLGNSRRSMTRSEWRATRTFLLLFVFSTLVPAVALLLFDHAQHFIIARLCYGIIYIIFIMDPITILCNGDAKEAMQKLLKQLKASINKGERPHFVRKQESCYSRERVNTDATTSL